MFIENKTGSLKLNRRKMLKFLANNVVTSSSLPRAPN